LTHTIARERLGEESDGTVILADPLSRIDFLQQVAPLGIRIDKLGFQKLSGAREFNVVVTLPGQTAVNSSPLNDHFAPSMFIEMEDADKMSRKSFELMKGGISLDDNFSISTGPAQVSDCDYDDKFNDPMAPEVMPDSTPFSAILFQSLVANNSVARSVSGRKSVAALTANARKPVERTDHFVVINTATGIAVAGLEAETGMTSAYNALWHFQKANPFFKANVVRESELQS
jgi:hypothetical protein